MRDCRTEGEDAGTGAARNPRKLKRAMWHASKADDIARYVRCQFIAAQRLSMGLTLAFHVSFADTILADLYPLAESWPLVRDA